MKFLLVLLLPCLFLVVGAQTNGEVKAYYLRFNSAALLENKSTPIVQDDTISLQALKVTYKRELGGGITALAVGAGLIASGAYLNTIYEEIPDKFGRDFKQKRYAGSSIALITAGVMSFTAGVFFTTTGVIKKHRYIEKISLGPASGSITVRF